jgi:Ca-activated chloride channel family protein
MVFCLVPLSLAGCARTAALPPVISLSGRIAAHEDALQMQGLADDLNDREDADKRLQGQVAPAAAPWSGTGAQVRNRRDLARFAADARARPRAFAARDTATGQAIRLSAARSAALPGCRRVIAIAGDGTGHAGCPALWHRSDDPALTVRGPRDCPRNIRTGRLRAPTGQEP